MNNKLLFLTIAMILIVPSLANAVIEWEFDFSKLNQSKFFEIDIANTTALIDLENNNSQVGFAYACHYEGQANTPSCWTTAGDASISTVNFDNHANSMKVTENGAAHGDFINGMTEGTGQAFIINKVIAPGTGATQMVFSHTDDTTYTAGAGFKTVADPNNIYTGEDPVATTNIRTSDNTSWFYVRIDSIANTVYVSNFTNNFIANPTTDVPTKWHIQSIQNTAADFYAAYVKLWSNTATRNISENKIQWNFTIATSTNAFTINVETDDIAKINVSVSCDEGANFVSGAANTTLTCSVGSTNKPIVFVKYNHTLGNLSYISLSTTAAADTTPPAVNITNFNATTKINDRLNISCQSFDSATIGNITFNLTGNADLYNFSFALTGVSANYSQNITMNLTRGNVVNSTCWASDSTGNLAQNSTLITIANTVPTHTTPIFNATDYPNNKTTANLTGFNQSSSDADSDYIVFNYKWYKNNVSNASRWINDSSLILNMPFDENSTKDFSGRGNDGIIYGVTHTNNGKIENAYRFNGSYVNLSGFDFPESEFTIEGWASLDKTNAVDVGRAFFVGGTGASAYLYIYVEANTQTLHSTTYDGATEKDITTSIASWSNNQFHHIAMTNKIGDSLKLYIDGNLINSITAHSSIPSIDVSVIGARHTSTIPWNGTIDEFRIYNRSLLASEISQNYQGTRDGFAVLDSDQTLKGENWTIEMTPYDEIEAGIPLNSTMITIADTLGTLEQIANATEIRINSVINITGRVTDADSDTAFGMVGHNQSGAMVNTTFSGLGQGTRFNFSQAITVTLSRGNVINFTTFYNDTAGTIVQGTSTKITVNDTAQNTPTILNPTLNTLYTASQIDLNLTWLLDADADAVTDVYWWVNATSKTNQSISVSGGNTGNTTFNASDGKYNLTVSICDAFSCSVNATIASFKIDTINPTTNLTTALPNMTFIRTDTNYTIGAEDSNLEVHNVSCVSGDDIIGTMLFSSEANLTGTINTFNLEVNTSWGDGRYTCLSNASDDHTTTINKNYTLTKDIATLKLDFLTSESKDDIISIKLKSSDIGLLDFYAYKSEDETKYIYIFNFSNTTANSNINHTYVIKYSSKNHKLSYRSQSKFKSHFTTPYNWIDCNLRTNYADLTSYSVKEAPADSGQFEATITTPETTLICDSIGGKNRIGQRTQAEIDTGIPQFFSLNVSRNGLNPNNTFFNNQTLNFSFNVSDKNINSTLFYVNDNKNISVLVISSNSTQNATITFPDGNYTILIEINDSAGNRINSTLLNVVVDTQAPVFGTAQNRTTANSTNILPTTDVNLSVFGFGDIYANTGNFSENCTSSSNTWLNHTSFNQGNGTYHLIIESANLTAGEVCGWKFYAYDLAGNELDPIYTFEIGSPAITTTIGGGGSSSGGSFNLNQLECNQKAKQQNRCLTYNSDSKSCDIGCSSGFSCNEDFVCEGAFLQPDYIPLANLLVPNLQEEQCLKQGYSFFQDSCFNCAGKLANLKGTIVCLQCKEDYRLDDNNVCVQTLQQRTISTLTPIDNLARKISPNNPFLGYMLMIGVAGIVIYAYSNREILKTKIRRQ